MPLDTPWPPCANEGMGKVRRDRSLTVLALEPYYGGSHRAFLAGLRTHSRHDVRVLGLPARKWKWRMRHAAVTLARRVRRLDVPDVILASEFLNVAEFAGMLPPVWQRVPRVIYFHENQLTYPVADEAQRDYQYAFTHLTSILASRTAYFNSRFHRDEFFEAMTSLLRRMPDYAPLSDLRAARRRSKVLHLGCDLGPLVQQRRRRDGPARILWTHRWEADKDPGAFLDAMLRLADDGHDFRLILLGEHFEKARETFAPQLRRLATRIEHAGFLPSRVVYRRTLGRADIVVSVARHEFFGAGVVEAIAAGAWPILPDRLAYPEILPKPLHRSCLYRTEGQLVSKLRWAIRNLDKVRATNVAPAVSRFDWPRMITRYDAVLARAADAE
jgi:glycosyltransferase involved in cell wall biosynthesis